MEVVVRSLGNEKVIGAHDGLVSIIQVRCVDFSAQARFIECHYVSIRRDLVFSCGFGNLCFGQAFCSENKNIFAR